MALEDHMPYQHLNDALYLVKQCSGSKVVDHFGILDVGDRMGLHHGLYLEPVVIHLLHPSIHIDLIREFGRCEIISRISDEAGARRRFHLARKNPTYDAIFNNCEHFAIFIATGRRQSPQLQGFVIGVGLAVVAYSAIKSR
jgi:hypothetical protein